MGGEICYKAGRERGPWFEIKCVQDNIRSKERRGESATFERNLLKAWVKYPGYEKALDGLSLEPITEKQPEIIVSKIPANDFIPPGNYETTPELIKVNAGNALRGRGRPRKTDGDISRTTEWRRHQEGQEVMQFT